MQDCTMDVATLVRNARRTRNSSEIFVPKMVMIPRMPAPVNMATGEMIKPATMEDVPDLGDEDAARKFVERQNHAA